jgi:hypothetical protein
VSEREEILQFYILALTFSINGIFLIQNLFLMKICSFYNKQSTCIIKET